MDLSVITIILSVFTYSMYYYFTRTFNYWKKRNVRGPKPVAFFGNLKESALRRKPTGVVFQKMYQDFPNEKVVGIYRMTTPCLLLRDLDIIKHVMIKDFDCFMDRGVEFSKKSLGVNLFHADGDTWQILRKRFTPIFTSGKLKNMLYLMIERGDKFINYVNSKISDNKPTEMEIYSLIQKYTVATISACAFGLDIDTLSDKMETLRKIDSFIFSANFAFELDMMYPGILRKLNSSLFPREVSEFFYELVKTVVDLRNGEPSNRKDFMDLLLELRKQEKINGVLTDNSGARPTLELTESLIAAQAFVFYAAGYETSATTMSFMLYELAKNPDIQDKIIAEIDEVLKKHDGKVTYEMLKDLTFLERVFDETLRMYPIADPLQRNARVDYKIPGTDVIVKKGQTVLVSPMGIHHDEKYYPNPGKFDPDRFNPGNIGERHSCAYLPFGVGPRNCIGMRFAQMQSRICITKLLSKFRVEPSKNTVEKMQFDPTRSLIGPSKGIYLKIVPRK